MKTLIKTLFLLLLCQAVMASEPPMLINHGIDGSWVDPNANSQGLVIETLPSTNTLVAFWFTFDLLGEGREWYIALGDINGAVANLNIYLVEGGVFNQASVTEETLRGTARLEFTSCTSATLEFELNAGAISDSIQLVRLTPDVACATSLNKAHATHVTKSNQWLDVQGSWVFDVCINLGPNESHGREVFVFNGTSMSFDMDHYNAADCQGPKTVRHRAFELTRVDKSVANLGEEQVIANRVSLIDLDNNQPVKQILYFDTSVVPPVMAHGDFDGGLDEEGYPATLHQIFASPSP